MTSISELEHVLTAIRRMLDAGDLEPADELYRRVLV